MYILILIQLQDCGMILEEQPAKVVEAFRLFLQGNGYGKIFFFFFLEIYYYYCITVSQA
jgi:hypothetical protein